MGYPSQVRPVEVQFVHDDPGVSSHLMRLARQVRQPVRDREENTFRPLDLGPMVGC